MQMNTDFCCGLISNGWLADFKILRMREVSVWRKSRQVPEKNPVNPINPV
jgi:hypothetical protein